MVPVTMFVLNFSMFSVALPTLRETFALPADLAAWLITAYTLPFIVFMPLYGRLGDGLGKRRLFLLGIVLFVAGTGITLAAGDLRLLVLGRVIQGVGSGGIDPLSIAIISERFPPGQRGRALGTWNSIGPLTALAGLLSAGLVVDHLGWRAIFALILLAGLIALLAVQRLIPPGGRRFVQPGFLRTFDWGGVVLLSAATTALVFYASSRPITGVEALRDWRLLALAVGLFGSFVLWERRRPAPFVALSIFALPNFSRASVTAGLRMFALNGSSFLLPLYLADVHRMSAAATGLWLMLQAGAMLLTMRLGGQLADRRGSRWPIVGGLSVQAGSLAYLAWLPGSASLAPVVAGLIVNGLGAGISLAAMHRATMSRVPPQQTGEAAGLYSMIRFAGTVLGPALAGVVLQRGLERSLAPVAAYQPAFWFIAGGALLGAAVGWSLRE